MRRLATLALAAVVLPAFGDTQSLSDSAWQPLQLPSEVQGLSPEVAALQKTAGTAVKPPPIKTAIYVRSLSTCYYMRQVNQNLQKPKDKPVLVPLASAAAAPIANSNTDCLSDSILRKAVAR